MDLMTFIVPVTIILVQLLKTLEVPTKLLSVLALVVGGALGGLYATYYGADVFEAVFTGFLQGAVACGLYDVARNTTKYILDK